MTRVHSAFLYRALFLIFALLDMTAQLQAADAPPALTARETGVALYARQDAQTDRIATLEKGETLFPMAEAIGSEIWYMVRTKQGLVGWVRGADGWNGVWHAVVEGRPGEHSGSWSAEFPHVRNAIFSDLFGAAVKEAMRGLWTGGNASGSWSIRYVKPQ